MSYCRSKSENWFPISSRTKTDLERLMVSSVAAIAVEKLS